MRNEIASQSLALVCRRCDIVYSIFRATSLRRSSSLLAFCLFIARVALTCTFFVAFCIKCFVFMSYFLIKIKWWREYLCTRTFSVPRKQMFQIDLLRTHPRFSSATRPLYFSQSLRYPFGRGYSVTPISLRRERKLNELLPRHQQCAGKSCPSVRCLTIPVPCVKRADTVGKGGVRSLNPYPPTQIQRTKKCRGLFIVSPA